MTGKKIDEYSFECSEGSMQNKGMSRFTSREHLSELMSGYDDLKIEKTTTTLMNEEKVIAEWIVEATKMK